MKDHTIPWYAREIKTAIGFPSTTPEFLVMSQLASILTRWLAKEVPHGTTKRRIKNLHRDAIALDAQRAGEP